jgi:catechol 2,3-dioxygenase-like lactoylglutathione lyase family enzyme
LAHHQVRWLFHATAMVGDYVAARDRLTAIAGLYVLEDTEQWQPDVGRRGGMTWIGDNSLELGQPIVKGGGAARFVERSGPGLHSIAVQVDDCDATVAFLERRGVRIAARPAAEFVFSDPRDTGGVFIEWFSGELEFDPRFGAPRPRPSARALVEIVNMAFVGAVVDAPVRLADRLAGLLGTEVTFRDSGAPAGQPAAGVSLGDCTLALYPMTTVDESEQLWGSPYRRPRTHLLALRCPDVDVAANRLDDASVEVLRRDDNSLVLSPAASGRVPLLVTDRLLPGDPRSAA